MGLEGQQYEGGLGGGHGKESRAEIIPLYSNKMSKPCNLIQQIKTKLVVT